MSGVRSGDDAAISHFPVKVFIEVVFFMKVKKNAHFFGDLRGTFGSLWFYEAEDSLVLFHFPFLSSDKILMQQNMIHTISKDFWQWKCQNIRQ